MDGFESVADVWECARYDDRHRIVDVGTFHFGVDIDRDYLVVVLHFSLSKMKLKRGGRG